MRFFEFTLTHSLISFHVFTQEGRKGIFFFRCCLHRPHLSLDLLTYPMTLYRKELIVDIGIL